jgi:hypothetical protein
MPDKSNAAAKRPNSETPNWFISLIARMELEASSDDESFMSPMITSMEKILQAESEEAMWDSDELDQTGGRDLNDVEQQILEYDIKFSARESDIKSAFVDSHGRGMYLLIRSARLDNGEEFVWNTSAPLLVGKILWLSDHGKLPAQVVIRSTELGGGRKLLKLKPVPKRAIQTEAPF